MVMAKIKDTRAVTAGWMKKPGMDFQYFKRAPAMQIQQGVLQV
jgi:hypothetical protein